MNKEEIRKSIEIYLINFEDDAEFEVDNYDTSVVIQWSY